MGNQVQVREDTKKREKDAEIIWKIFDDELSVQQKEEDIEKQKHQEYLNQREKRERDEQVVLVKQRLAEEKEKVIEQDKKMVS